MGESRQESSSNDTTHLFAAVEDDDPQLTVGGRVASIGTYRLLEAIGEGGMGVVYVAEQAEPVRRRVALKLIKPGMDSRQVVARFEAERQALAMMDHPNIARVFDGGMTEAGRPYFVMELVPGVPITEYCDQAQLPVAERLRLFVSVCQAVQHAHQKGIIHRDIKPTNVLVTLLDGQPVPKVIDFGVAKATAGSLTDKTLNTAVEGIVGTPPYMSPEQAGAWGQDVDTRSDVYSLGVLLYELLSGTPPFDREMLRRGRIDQVWRMIREQEPPRPSVRFGALGELRASVAASRGTEPGLLVRTVRGELDWIVMKAMDKDRRRRYDTASDLAADVTRYLTDLPVEACPPSRWYRFGKFARRNRPALVATALISLSLAAGTAFSTWQALRARRAERRTATALELAQTQRRLTERHLFAARLRQADQAVEQGHVERAQEILNAVRPRPGEPDIRGFAWGYLWRESRRDIVLFEGHEAEIHTLVLAPDGRRLATGDNNGTIIVWDVATGQPRTRLTGHSFPVRELAFSRDQQRLASMASPPGGLAQEVWIWDPSTGHRVAPEGLQGKGIPSVGFSPSGRQLVVIRVPNGDGPLAAELFDIASDPGRAKLVWSQPVDGAVGIARDGDHLAAAPVGGRLTVFDTETLQPRWSTSGDGPALGWPSLAAGGGWLAAREAAGGGDVVVFEAATGRERPRVHDAAPSGGGPVRHLASPDGSKLLVVGDPAKAILFDLTGPAPVRLGELSIAAPENHRVAREAFSRDGSKLALITMHTLGGQGPVTVWETAGCQLVGTYPGRRRACSVVEFTPDGSSIMLNGENAVQRWRFERPKAALPDALEGHRDEAWSAAFSPLGDVLATGSDDTDDSFTIRLWDPTTGELRLGWSGGLGTVASLAFSPHGDILVSAHLDDGESVRFWEAASGALIERPAGHAGKVRCVAFSPDGRWVASGGDDHEVRLWDASTRQTVLKLTDHTDKVRHVAFSPDGRFLASAGNDKTVCLWEVATGQTLQVLGGPVIFSAVAFTPDGALLVAADEAGRVTVWDARSGIMVRRFHDEEGAIRCLAFARDGHTLATSGEAKVIRLWDIVTGQELLRLSGHGATVNALAFSPNGRALASCSHDGAVRLWWSDPSLRMP